MEIEDLKAIWQKYDSKLDHLEKMNKKLIMKTLSKKNQKRLNRMKYRSFYSLFMVPFILIVALQENFRIEYLDLKFITGCFLTLIFISVMCYLNFKGFMVLKGVDLSNDSIIESSMKINDFKRYFVNKRKFSLMYFPLFFAGVILIGWNRFHFDSNLILIWFVVFAVSLTIGNKQLKIYKGKIEQLEKEISELNEYVEEKRL